MGTMTHPIALKEALDSGAEKLRSYGIESPTVVVELLLIHVLKCKRGDLYMNLNQELTISQIAHFDTLLTQRIEGKPVQYITQSANFFGLELYLDENVLIPRPETEILVEAVLNKLSGTGKRLKIFDWGTGSGNIAIALAAHLDCEIYAVDISEKALKVAERNVLTHGIEHKIKLLQGDSFSTMPKNLRREIDAVVSNPPYVKMAEMDSLPREVKDFEPKEALFDKEDGLYYTKEIIAGAKDFLKSKGLLALEVASGEAQKVANLIEETKQYGEIEVIPDLAGIERVILARKR